MGLYQSERIIITRFESKYQNTTIIQVHAPTNDTEEEEKEDFYHQFQTVFNKRKSRDVTLFTREKNAKVRSDSANRETTMGSHGDGIMNKNVELFCDFCATNELVIGGTLEHSFHTRNPISSHGHPLMA